MSAEESLALRAEFDVLLRRSGITVPEERYAGTLANYVEMRKLTALLRQPRSVESEPANVYSISMILRTLENEPAPGTTAP